MSFREFASSTTSFPFLEAPFSPIPTHRALPTAYDSLQDDLFDSSFSFLNPDYFASAPSSPSPAHSDMVPTQGPARAQVHDGTPVHPVAQAEGSAGPSTAIYPIPIGGLTLVSPPPHQYDGFQVGAQPINYAAMPFSTPQSAPHHSTSLPNTHGFHPYHPATFRSAHHLSRSPDHPGHATSPLIPGFSPSQHHTPPGVSPNLVSPASVLSSVGSLPSDVSPLQYGYSIPSGPSIYAGTPLSSMTNLSNASPGHAAGLSMVAGFPYPTTSRSPRRVVPPVPRPKPRTRASTTSRASASVKKEPKDTDDGEGEDESMNGDDEASTKPKSRGGLGLSPATNDSDDRIAIRSQDIGDIKQARILSEQRRRDELRAGFDKLREALPQSSLRASKVSVLDRAVSHIQQIESANHYLLEQVDGLNRELERLRAINQEVAHAVAINTRAGSGSSPGSSGRPVGN